MLQRNWQCQTAKATRLTKKRMSCLRCRHKAKKIENKLIDRTQSLLQVMFWVPCNVVMILPPPALWALLHSCYIWLEYVWWRARFNHTRKTPKVKSSFGVSVKWMVGTAKWICDWSYDCKYILRLCTEFAMSLVVECQALGKKTLELLLLAVFSHSCILGF